MNNKVLFMIVNNELKYLKDTNMDHREWYVSLGYDASLFENIVRGYVIDNKIIFFKGIMFNYDEEVIKAARVYTPSIRYIMNNPSLEVYCGILVNGQGQKWEPILKINENEITGFVKEEKKEEKEIKELGSAIEFKNDYTDSKFIKRAIIVTGIVLVLTLIIKINLFSKQEILKLNSFFDIFLSISQVFLLSFIIYSYKKKFSFTKYLSIGVSILIILTLDICDVIIGVLYFLFSIDQNYFVNFINFIKKLFNKNK